MHAVLQEVTQYTCYMMGDFNLDLVKYDKHLPTKNFLGVIYTNSFIPTINRPTRVTEDTCTLIDYIYYIIT